MRPKLDTLGSALLYSYGGPSLDAIMRLGDVCRFFMRS
jgi:hypothetical protein